MKLFISKGLRRFFGYQIKLKRVDDIRAKLTFCTIKKDENGKERYENLEFIVPLKEQEMFSDSKDYECSSSKLKKTLKGYNFTHKRKDNDKVAYALLYYDKVFPSDVYIPINMKKYIQLIEQIQFYDVEPDYGEEIVKVYFVRINIPYGETLPFYFSYRNDFSYLKQHLIFSKNNYLYSTIDVDNYLTHIKLDSLKRKDYISLSEL